MSEDLSGARNPVKMDLEHMSTGSEDASSDSAASPSEEPFLRPTNASAGPEGSGQYNESTPANDIEVTEGGWICRVERIEKRVDSAGRSHYYHEENQADLLDRFLEVDPASGPHFTSLTQHPNRVRMQEGKVQDDKVQEEKVQKDVRRSIILHYYYITKNRGGLVEPGAYIEIRSPLILKFLRENAKFDEEVRPPRALFLQEFDYLNSRSADPSGSLWKPTRPPFMNLTSFYGINTTH